MYVDPTPIFRNPGFLTLGPGSLVLCEPAEPGREAAFGLVSTPWKDVLLIGCWTAGASLTREEEAWVSDLLCCSASSHLYLRAKQ